MQEWRNVGRAEARFAIGAAWKEKKLGPKVRGAALGRGLEAKMRSRGWEEVWGAPGHLASPREMRAVGTAAGRSAGQKYLCRGRQRAEEAEGELQSWPCSARGGKA